MVVGVVERRCRVEVQERQTTNTVGPCEESVVLLDGADGTVPRCARTRSRSRAGHLRPTRRSDVRRCNRRCALGCSPAPPCPRRSRVGKIVSESPGTPSVRSPFHVNANAIQRSELSIVACTSAADCTRSSTSGRACPRKPPCAATPSDLIGGHVRVLAVLQEAGALVLPDEPHTRLRVLLPILQEPFEIGEHGRDAGLAEQRHGHAGVLGYTGS